MNQKKRTEFLAAFPANAKNEAHALSTLSKGIAGMEKNAEADAKAPNVMAQTLQ